MIVSQTKREMG